MKAAGLGSCEKDMGCRSGLMEPGIKGSGTIIKLMGRESLYM